MPRSLYSPLPLLSPPPTFLAASRRSPKSPLLSSSSTARRTKSSTSPMAWRSSNAAPRPWSRCGWTGPGTMTLNSTASTSSAFGSSSPRSWPANATSGGSGRGFPLMSPLLPVSLPGLCCWRCSQFVQPQPQAQQRAGGRGATGAFPLGHGTTVPPNRGVGPGAAGTTGQAGKRWQLPPSPLPRKTRAHPLDGESLASDVPSSPLLNQRSPEFPPAALTTAIRRVGGGWGSAPLPGSAVGQDRGGGSCSARSFPGSGSGGCGCLVVVPWLRQSRVPKGSLGIRGGAAPVPPPARPCSASSEPPCSGHPWKRPPCRSLGTRGEEAEHPIKSSG